jgi:3D-(3,5/4)-trihydroxycyclohexane-1,2-dione acylhydrolase (decyclizing)
MSSPARSETIRLTMGQAIVKYLQAQYSERDGERRRLIPAVFGIFGHGNVAGLGQALFEYGDDLPYYQPCNEQSMVHTAIGYAKTMLRTATLACTSSVGPGATNMITGAATATINRIPVLLLPSDYYATRHQGNVLQQLEHPLSADVSVNDCFRPVSRFFDRLTRPEHLLTALPEAMRVLTDPAETGAVTLSLPQDIQAHAYDYPAHLFAERTWRIERRPPPSERIAEAAALLKAAKRPLIIAGGGVHYADASAELRAFAEAASVPVCETSGGKGAWPGESPLFLGGAGVNGTPAAALAMQEADLVIAVGTRLGDFATGSQSAFQDPEVRFIAINVNAHDAYKMGALPVIGDARETLRALHQAVTGTGRSADSAYLDRLRAAQDQWTAQVREEVYTQHPGEAMSQGELIGLLNAEAQPGDTTISAAGGLPGDLLKLCDASGGKVCHFEYGYSCMGYEIPAAVGVRLAQPSGEVYAFVGDGTYLMNPTELVTALQEGLKITVVISENHGFQIIRNLQMNTVGRSFGNEFRARDAASRRLEGAYIPIDFVQNAASMGARTWHATTADGVRQALREAREETRSCVIVVETEPHRYLPGSGIWWDVEPAEVTGDPETDERRTTYENERARRQRFYY